MVSAALEARRSAQDLLEAIFSAYVAGRLELPESHRERIPDLGIQQVVCDYVAGMTDTFAAAKFKEAKRLSECV